jgi:hypothetical protein
MIAHEETADMAEEFFGTDSISEDEWIEAIQDLAKRPGTGEIFVQIFWPRGHLLASGFQPHINKRTFHILLRQRTRADLGDASIDIDLPELEGDQGQYEKLESGSELYLSFSYPEAQLQISTSLEFLGLVTSEPPIQ